MGLAPCITTYQAMFNGRSRFFRDDILAAVFDDAHTAEHLLRDHFTLKINREQLPETFCEIVQLFRNYHENIGKGTGYAETQERQDPHTSWFVPPFVIHNQFGGLQQILVSANLSENQETMFAWEHLKDHIDLWAIFISGKDISITPPIVPVRTLQYFKSNVRRVYLSATLAASDAFLRTFGKVPEPIIMPRTTAGECERLIIIPSLHEQCDDDVKVAKDIIDNQKALILVPSYRRRFDQWSEIDTRHQGDDVTDQVEYFKNTQKPAKLILVSRYDGIDLPGETCLLMIIDDLPSGIGPVERYLWDKLGLAKTYRSAVASRIVQSFGRISRGMSDNGVVVLTGKKLVEWLLNPKNRAILPHFLSRQLELGISVSKNAGPLVNLIDAAQQCLNRDPNWIQYYQNMMTETLVNSVLKTDEEVLSLARVEVDFGHLLWSRDFEGAAGHIEGALEKTFQTSSNSGSWHALWLGYCYERKGDIPSAHELYRRAHNVSLRNIPPLDIRDLLEVNQQIPHQVLEVARYLHGGPQINRAILTRIDRELAQINVKGSTSQTDEALKALGQYLGLKAIRPDNEFGTGPDVLWYISSGPALCIETKVGKKTGSYYRKRDIGQLRDHIQWVRDNTDASEIFPCFVGPKIPASSDSNPGSDIVMIELEEFKVISERLRAALKDICERALPSTIANTVYAVFQERYLIWPELYDHINKTVLLEIIQPLNSQGE